MSTPEQVMMDDAPIIVLWYTENYKLIQSNVRNYFTNPMNYEDYSAIYFKVMDELVTERGQ